MLPHGFLLEHDPASNGPPLNVVKLYWSRSGIMHVAIAWDNKPLLLLATALLPNRITESLQMEAGAPYDKQRIQMGLPSDNTVLYFRSGVDHYQSVLIALAADLHTSISFGSVSRRFALTLLGCLNSWLALTAVLPWTRAGSEVGGLEGSLKGA